MAKRPKHGIRRGAILEWPEGAPNPDDVAKQVTYTGSALHKSYPSPAGPPALRADKAKCDVYDARDWPKLLTALQRAIRAKCVGAVAADGYPQRAWVWINGVLHEARSTGGGDYHGFPLNDPRQYPLPLSTLQERAPHVEIPHR